MLNDNDEEEGGKRLRVSFLKAPLPFLLLSFSRASSWLSALLTMMMAPAHSSSACARRNWPETGAEFVSAPLLFSSPLFKLLSRDAV
jgi:hypothetical protein